MRVVIEADPETGMAVYKYSRMKKKQCAEYPCFYKEARIPKALFDKFNRRLTALNEVKSELGKLFDRATASGETVNE